MRCYQAETLFALQNIKEMLNIDYETAAGFTKMFDIIYIIDKRERKANLLEGGEHEFIAIDIT